MDQVYHIVDIQTILGGEFFKVFVFCIIVPYLRLSYQLQNISKMYAHCVTIRLEWMVFIIWLGVGQTMFLDKYVAEIQRLTTALHKAFERLEQYTDDEALHDYRVIVRRIRSIIGPLSKVPENQALRETAAVVARLTTPIRDLEVLIAELEKRGYPEQAEERRALLQDQYQAIVGAPEVQRLFDELEKWPAEFAKSELGDDSAKLKQVLSKALKKHLKRLQAGVIDVDVDRHQLRILAKRARYIVEAFPSLSPLSVEAVKELKKAQSDLGDWHDSHQWGLRAQRETDLEPLAELWKASERQELLAAEKGLKKLLAALPIENTKK